MFPIPWQRYSKRIQDYDYSKKGLYFVTINCAKRQLLFGTIDKGMMKLNDFGEIAYQEWLKTPSISPNSSLGAFMIMPDHIHGII